MNGPVLSLVSEPGEIASETSSTLKAFGVLELLVRAGRAVTLSELMQATELPKPTLHRTLALFEEAGFLSREPGGRAYHRRRLSRLVSTRCAMTPRRPNGARFSGCQRDQRGCNLAVMYRGIDLPDRIEANWPLRLQIPIVASQCCRMPTRAVTAASPPPRGRPSCLLEIMALSYSSAHHHRPSGTCVGNGSHRVGYAVDNGSTCRRYLLSRAGAQPTWEIVAAVAAGATARLPPMSGISRAAAAGGRRGYRIHIRINPR
jgi:hypothetical protein